MRHVLSYVRVSSRPQEEGASLDAQENDGRALAASEGLNVDRVFRETFTATSLARPELDEVRRLIAAGDVEALVVWSPDRLSRDPLHLLLIAEECDKHNTRLLFVHEPGDFSLEGQLLTFVRGWAAKVENLRRVERSRIGRKRRVAEGRMAHGTGRGLYAYNYIKGEGRSTLG